MLSGSVGVNEPKIIQIPNDSVTVDVCLLYNVCTLRQIEYLYWINNTDIKTDKTHTELTLELPVFFLI